MTRNGLKEDQTEKQAALGHSHTLFIDPCFLSRGFSHGDSEQPLGARSEGLSTGGQCEGMVGLLEDPPAPSHNLCHPRVQPRWVSANSNSQK